MVCQGCVRFSEGERERELKVSLEVKKKWGEKAKSKFGLGGLFWGVPTPCFQGSWNRREVEQRNIGNKSEERNMAGLDITIT